MSFVCRVYHVKLTTIASSCIDRGFKIECTLALFKRERFEPTKCKLNVARIKCDIRTIFAKQSCLRNGQRAPAAARANANARRMKPTVAEWACPACSDPTRA